VEQHTSLVLGLAQRGYVLSNGRVAFESSASALRDSDDLKRIYLGQETSMDSRVVA
jgi:ABC-type branched-subunit amino acid transport system ATPase component